MSPPGPSFALSTKSMKPRYREPEGSVVVVSAAQLDPLYLSAPHLEVESVDIEKCQFWPKKRSRQQLRSPAKGLTFSELH